MAKHETGSVPENRRGACFSGPSTPRENQTSSESRPASDESRQASSELRPDSLSTSAEAPPASGTDALCPVCGGPAEGFGSFPIAEGLLCGDCAGKLSEWFPCRPTTTAAQIREQLIYREENRAALGSFHTSKILWSHPCVALDTGSGLFQISSQVGRAAKADILSFRQLLGCQVETGEQKKELFRHGRERYRPRRYEYRFEIFVRVLVSHPWFHEMRFRLHDRPIVVSDRMVQLSTAGKVVKNAEYQRCRRAAEEICAALKKAMEQSREAEPQETAPQGTAPQETESADVTAADNADGSTGGALVDSVSEQTR